MKFIVGYDRDFAAQCFRRNLTQLILPANIRSERINVAEVDYFAQRMAETSVFSSSSTFANPWILNDDSQELVKLSVRKATRAQLQRCELIANNILILEGVVGRAGASHEVSPEFREVLKKRIQTAVILFQKSSVGTFHSSGDREVLRRMSTHVFEWIRYLSFLPGNDFADLLSTANFSGLHISQ